VLLGECRHPPMRMVTFGPLPAYTEDHLRQLDRGLAVAERPSLARPVLHPSLALNELGEWLEDDRQWHQARGRHWVSLIDDLLKSCGAPGPGLGAYLARNAEPALREIRDCKGGLTSQGSQPPDVSLRRRLERAQRVLVDTLGQTEALVAAWEDFVAQVRPRERDGRARTLLGLAEAVGHDRQQLSRGLRALLADELLEVQRVRGDKISIESARERAGLSAAERLELAVTRLRQLPRRGHVVVWLKYSLAPMRWPWVIEIGERVTVFKAEWLRSVLSAGELQKLPDEVRGDTHQLEMLVGIGHEGIDVSKEDDLPEAVVRVDLGEVILSHAHDLASETSELLVSLASLHGAPPSIWQLTGGRISFVDGRSGGASFGTPRFFAPSSEQRLEMAQDDTAMTLDALASRLGPNLPMTRPQGRRAAQLLVWLRRARQTWEPGRLVLCDRVFEQVSGWAGVADRERFVREHQRLAWALRQVVSEIGGSWYALVNANSALSSERAMSEDDWQQVRGDPEIGFEMDDRRWRVNPQGVLRRLDFLLQRTAPKSPVHERLSRLRKRTKNGRATAKWVDELCADFDVLGRRALRTRNALVHGGPVADATARDILPFVETLAVDALHTAIEGELRNVDLVDYFLDQRAARGRCVHRLRQNEPPDEALFWQTDAD
jgi:hypothetical protein